MTDRFVYVHEQAAAALAAMNLEANVFPVVQGDPAKFPSVVYYGVGLGQIPTLRRPFVDSEQLRVESRATTYKQARAVDQKVLDYLARGGRLISIFSSVDTHENKVKVGLVFRRITGVRIR